jgi:hypothetical protein
MFATRLMAERVAADRGLRVAQNAPEWLSGDRQISEIFQRLDLVPCPRMTQDTPVYPS